jgi:hypothetical protein
MATLAADKPRQYDFGPEPLYTEYPIIASDTVYQGAAVGESSSAGTARPLVAGDTFLGFADEQTANEGGAASAKNVRVRTRGVIKLSVATAASAADNDDAVYASDDDTFTKASTGNTQIGKILRWVTGTTCMVYFEGVAARSI